MKFVQHRTTVFGAILSVLFAASVWQYIRQEAGINSPQGSRLYWDVGYPALIAGSGLIGAVFPSRPWRWGVLVIATQFVLSLITLEGEANLWPIGLVLHLAMMVPTVGASYLGVWLRAAASYLGAWIRWLWHNFRHGS